MVWSKYRWHESFWGAELQSQHLPVTLCIYNLPPWLCMKRKFIMMPVLIQSPKQPGNDIDVYLRPLVDELLQLWAEPGVRVWDEHKQEEFDLRALLFVTINDWPALSNISGQSNKGYNACTHCLDETESIYLNKSRKNVYPYYRRFLPPKHQLRKKASISTVRQITGSHLRKILVMMYTIWSKI